MWHDPLTGGSKRSVRTGAGLAVALLLCLPFGCASRGEQESLSQPVYLMQTTNPRVPAPPRDDWPAEIPEQMTTQEYTKLSRGAKAVLTAVHGLAEGKMPLYHKAVVKDSVAAITNIQRPPAFSVINDWYDQRPRERAWLEAWWDESRRQAAVARGWRSLPTTRPAPIVDTESADEPTKQPERTDGLSDDEVTALNSLIDELEDPEPEPLP